MIRYAVGATALIAAMVGAALAGAVDARAASRFDGSWSLAVYTRYGPCDQSYRFSGRIANGVISYGGIGLNLSGYVNSRGGAYAKVSSGSSYAVAYGSMNLTRGSGTWRGRTSAGYCSGVWTATRT